MGVGIGQCEHTVTMNTLSRTHSHTHIVSIKVLLKTSLGNVRMLHNTQKELLMICSNEEWSSGCHDTRNDPPSAWAVIFTNSLFVHYLLLNKILGYRRSLFPNDLYGKDFDIWHLLS